MAVAPYRQAFKNENLGCSPCTEAQRYPASPVGLGVVEEVCNAVPFSKLCRGVPRLPASFEVPQVQHANVKLFLSLSCDKASDIKISQVLDHVASLLAWIDNTVVTLGERCKNILVQEAQTICRDIHDVPAACTGGGADAVCTRSFEQ